MSGHSHFSTIKRKKGLEDKKRGNIFSKLSRIISVAAKEGGDPAINPKLKQAIEEGKAANMPKENVERAIKRGTGELADGQLMEEISYEAFGPGGITLIIDSITDNKNRTLSEIKQIFNKYNGKLANEGSVKWLFEKKGIITLQITNYNPLQTKENLELAAIEAGAENFEWYTQENEEFLDIQTKPDEIEKTKKNLQRQGIKIESAAPEWMAKEKIEVSEKDKAIIEKLFEELGENDAVQEIYSNLKV